MGEHVLFPWLLAAWIALAAIVLVVLLRISAPYGRHSRSGWGPTLPAKAGWVLMELPAVVVPAILFALGDRHGPAAWIFLGLWEAHYLHRVFVYPFRLRGAERRSPWAVVGMALAFNVVNGYLNGRYLFALGPERNPGWLVDPRFLVGLSLFGGGMLLNLWADQRLRSLRAPGETGYRIPQGGAFRLVSCPNYLGEIVEWIGWAILTWSPAGLAFAIWTAANLVPRALSHHRWYQRTFPDYPAERRAVVPGLL